MDQYPNSDEEFELQYGDELELLREQDEAELVLQPSNPPPNNSQDLFTSDVSISNATVEQFSLGEQSKKRGVQELFGDIDDILFEEQPFKRKKEDSLEADLEMIEHIVNLRKMAQLNTPLAVRHVGRDLDKEMEHKKRNVSRRVPNYPFIGVTGHDGERFYVRFHSEEYEKEELVRIVNNCSFNELNGSSKELWRQAREIVNKSLERSEHNEEQVKTIETRKIDNQKLWVELYKPKRYMELLSDESVNRNLLHWLKMWDRVVFNRMPKVRQQNVKESFGNHKFFQRREDFKLSKFDEHGRPEFKVALLCGPPGLGKTTLAHVLARHTGYNVVEINASDDRSTQAFKTSLENATQMRSVLDQEKRPNCIIFDEIDGAPAASIEYLIKFINGTSSAKTKNQKKEGQILKRPIICICNDVYVPALRALRQIAFVVTLPQTASTKLAQRLIEIAKLQKLPTNFNAMLALAEKTHNDIRSCLSVLHFFKSENKTVKLSDITNTDVGEKDIQKGLFQVWQEILMVERLQGEELKSSAGKRAARILQTVQAFGDYDRLAQGVFENFPLMNCIGGEFEGVIKALEWFSFADVLNTKIQTLQNYSLMAYWPHAFVLWHFAFAGNQKPQLKYPTANTEARSKLVKRQGILNELLKGVPAHIREHHCKVTLLLDTLPLLLKIITPKLRPVSLHLYTKEERGTLLNLVNIMLDYNLNYVQEWVQDGMCNFLLDPHIEELVSFSTSPKKGFLSFSNMHLISQEIASEKIRRAQSQEKPKKNSSLKETKDSSLKEINSNVPNHLQQLQPKTMKKVEPAVCRDFFGRIIPNAATSSETNTKTQDIWFKYKEGYNNAVRMKIKIKDLKKSMS